MITLLVNIYLISVIILTLLNIIGYYIVYKEDLLLVNSWRSQLVAYIFAPITVLALLSTLLNEVSERYLEWIDSFTDKE